MKIKEEIQAFPSPSRFAEMDENQCVGDEEGMAKNSNQNDLAVSNEGDSDREPYLGMKFESEEAAEVFYDAYATHMGFIMRVDAFSPSMCDGDMTCRRLVCDKECFHKCSPKQSGNRKGRAITQEGCKAMIVVKKEKTGKWVVTEFFKEHNHPLVIAPAKASRTAQLSQTPAGWVWKRELLQGVKCKIKLYYRDSIVGHIQSVLQCVGGEETVQQFRLGCFGHFLQYTGGISCNKALHALLAQEIITPGGRDDQVWFHINDRHIRFTCTEYALVTGLNFGSSMFYPQLVHEAPDGIYHRLFGAAPISIKDLWKKFNDRLIGGSADDYLKVANILLLYLMLIGCKIQRLIDEWVWVLVEDAARWNNFPWGAYTFQVLMYYIRILPSNLSTTKYDFHGPVFALQIWAYEAISELGSTCAHMDGLVSIPRCLKWSFPSFPWRSIDFSTFFNQELECKESLSPTRDELVQPYWRSLQQGNPLGVRYLAKGNPIKLGLLIIRRTPSVASPVIQSPETCADTSVDVPVHHSRHDAETNVDVSAHAHDTEEPFKRPGRPAKRPSMPAESNASPPQKTSYRRSTRHQRSCDPVYEDTTAFEERLPDKMAERRGSMSRYYSPLRAPTPSSEDKRDEEIQELRAELKRERRKSAALQQQLDCVVKDMEEHSKHLLRSVDQIKSRRTSFGDG